MYIPSLAFLDQLENQCGTLHLQSLVNQVKVTATIMHPNSEGNIVEWFETYSYNQAIGIAKFTRVDSKGGIIKLIKTYKYN